MSTCFLIFVKKVDKVDKLLQLTERPCTVTKFFMLYFSEKCDKIYCIPPDFAGGKRAKVTCRRSAVGIRGKFADVRYKLHMCHFSLKKIEGEIVLWNRTWNTGSRS